MAKVKFGVLAGDVRKSIGAVTYSKNRFGPYVRARTAPVQPRTALQLARRDLLTQLSADYRTLTDPQRDGWNALGLEIVRTDSLGSTYNPTGLQVFVGVNLVRSTFDESAVLDAPALDTPPPVGILAAVATEGGTVQVSGPDLDPAADYMVYGTATRSAGRTFVTGIDQTGLIRGGEWKLLFVGSPSSGSPRVFTLSALYTGRFGALTSKVGTRVCFAVVPVSANRFIYPPVRVDAIVESAG